MADFTFHLKPRALPFISVKDCVTDEKYWGLDKSKKMVKGRTKELLWTLEEYRLIDRCYITWDINIKEVYCAKAEIGFFKPAIKEFFDGKENSPKDSVQRALYKLDLNGATHGRAMIKLMTAEEGVAPDIQDALDGIANDSFGGIHLKSYGRWKDNHEGEPEELTNPLVGMTAMSHARCRLISHCMALIEYGYHIFMNDTDSLVTDAPPSEVDRLLKAEGWENWIIDGTSKEMDDTLGRFEVEKYNGEAKIARFYCWGLKRYAEFVEPSLYDLIHGEYFTDEDGLLLRLRKSAFAGMHDEDQKQILGQPYKKQLRWYSKSKKWTDKCYALRNHVVEAEAEDVFAHGY